MNGVAFINNFAPETVALTNGKSVYFQFKKEVFTDASEIEELRFLQANGVHVFEAESTTEEAVELERADKARKDEETMAESMADASRRAKEELERNRAAIHRAWLLEKKQNHNRQRLKREAAEKQKKAREFFTANKPREGDSARETKIRQRILGAKRDFDAGILSEADYVRTDLLLREAIDEVRLGIPGIVFDGQELATAELTLRLEELKRAPLPA